MNTERPLAPNPQEYTVLNNQIVSPAQKRFYTSPLCDEARKQLQALVNSPDYNTNPQHPTGNPIPFVERHLQRLSMYPKTNLDGYMSNLKLMTSTKHSKPAA